MHVHASLLALTLIAAAAGLPLRGAIAPQQSSRSPWLRTDTARFEIHYLPALARDIGRVTRSAERAYDHVGARLNFVLATKVPLVLSGPSAAMPTEAVIAYALSDDVAPQRPHRSRIVLPVTERDADLDAAIVHELTHLLFGEIILPSQPGTGGVPRWVQEGIAHHMVGQWSEADTSLMRTLAASDRIPTLSRLTDETQFENRRVNDVLGHAAFDYIASRWGDAGIRAFVEGLIVPRVDRIYENVIGLAPQEFDAAFQQYAKRRFHIGAKRL